MITITARRPAVCFHIHMKELPTSESEGWKTINEIQVRKVAEGLFMMRQGAEGTAVAMTSDQLERYFERSKKPRPN